MSKKVKYGLLIVGFVVIWGKIFQRIKTSATVPELPQSSTIAQPSLLKLGIPEYTPLVFKRSYFSTTRKKKHAARKKEPTPPKPKPTVTHPEISLQEIRLQQLQRCAFLGHISSLQTHDKKGYLSCPKQPLQIISLNDTVLSNFIVLSIDDNEISLTDSDGHAYTLKK